MDNLGHATKPLRDMASYSESSHLNDKLRLFTNVFLVWFAALVSKLDITFCQPLTCLVRYQPTGYESFVCRNSTRPNSNSSETSLGYSTERAAKRALVVQFQPCSLNWGSFLDYRLS